MRLLSLAILLLSSFPALAQFGAQAVSAGRWEPRNYTNSLGMQLLFCSYWTNGILTNSPTTVSYWTNRLGNGFDLSQGAAASQPTLTNDAPWGGLCLYFDGSNDSMATAAMASMVQPTVVIWGGRQVTWTDSDRIFNGLAGAVRCSQYTTSPRIRIYAGSASIANDDLAVGAWGVVTTVANGADSSITVDNGTVVTGNAGTENAQGLYLGSVGTINCGNIETFGLIVMTNTSAAATNYARLGFLGMANTK